MRKLSEKSSIVLCVLSMMLLLQVSFSISCIQKEQEALLQFKRSFCDPSHRLASWNNGTDCCNWNGVGCNQTTGHVTMIDLRNDYQVDYHSRLTANSIHSRLFELKHLNYLDLSGNNFNHTQIPNFLGSMVELTYLNLSSAFFSGKVPPHLGNLSKLYALDLAFNVFDDGRWGQLNSNVEWVSHLSSLQFLWLSWMDFSKASNLMQLISSLPLLSSLGLIECNLQSIHFSLSSLNYSSFLSRIQFLDLSKNELNGPTPKAFQNMTSLTLLDLSRNKLTTIEGGLSSFIRNNCGLEVIDLSRNYNLGGDHVFGSHVNESIGCSEYYLQKFSLRFTSLRTRIPDWLEKLKKLKSIDLGYSQIYGPIPASLGNLSNLEYLDLSTNALTGVIPTSFGRLLNLKVLNLSSNSLKGVLTEAHFVNLSQLYILKLSYNELLSLDMKSNWIPPFQLQIFYATSMCIGCFVCEFPQWLQTQKALVELRLSNTSLSTSLPTWFTPQNLTILSLFNNQIMGPLPTNIADQMPKLEVLVLSGNLINGSLPPSLCKLKKLYILDLSNNRLSGTIQGCFLIPNLWYLDLSWNNFSGTFPYSHGNFSNIGLLFLKNNNFEGTMPIVLKNSKNLKVLDLGGNKFSGNIPKWVGNNLGSLQLLILRGNLFNGTIPSSLCKLTNLRILDLAHNQLEGSIPPNLSNFHHMIRNNIPGISVFCGYVDHGLCFGSKKNVEQSIKLGDFNYSMIQLLSMANIDLSNNSLTGFIPTEITMLKSLITLNLSHNSLMGTIPTEIGEIESLQSLDLSFNQLSGPIPRSLSKLNSLGALRLSHNNFSGNIPREGHLSTFNEVSSFDDNPYLCGDPLPMKCRFENPSEPPFNNIDNQDQEEDKWEKWLLYIMIILGFIVGFWTVVGVSLNKSR